MNMPLSDDDKRRLVVRTEHFLIRSGIVSKDRRQQRDSGDYAETDAGRDRRQMRRQAIARKREFLA